MTYSVIPPDPLPKGAAASGANSDIHSLSGLTTPLSTAQGGNGSNYFSLGDVSAVQTSTPITLTATSPTIQIYDSTAGNLGTTLPAASTCIGKIFYFINVGTGGNKLTVNRAGSDYITSPGQTTQQMFSTCAYSVISNGNNGWIALSIPFLGSQVGMNASTGTIFCQNAYGALVKLGQGSSGQSLISTGGSGTPAFGTLGLSGGGTGGTTAPTAQAALLVDTFQSPDQTITAAGTLTLAHGRARVPQKVWFALVNQTGEAGYTTGQVVFVPGPGATVPSVTNDGYSVIVDTNFLTIRYGSDTSTFTIPHATTGAATAITNANWKCRFFAQ